VFVLPSYLALRKAIELSRWRRRIGDFSYQVGSGGFGDAIDQYSEKRYLQEDKEANTEAEEYTFPITEPSASLLLGIVYTREVRLELIWVNFRTPVRWLRRLTSSLIRLLEEK